jgi:hypothetical protein
MKRTLLSIAAFVLLLSACKKDDAAPAEEWILTKFTNVDVERQDTITTSLKYNISSVLSELTESGADWDQPYSITSYPVFEGSRLTKIMESDLEVTTPAIRNSFEYTGNNVTRINTYGFDQAQEWTIEEYFEVLYNSQNKISELRRKSVASPEYVTLYKLTWENENVKSMTVFNVYATDTSQSNTENYTYDNKPSLVKALFKDNYMWLSSPSSFELLSANNLVKQETVFNGEVYSRDTYEFKFNEKNQLTEQQLKSEQLIDQPSVSNSIVTFTYTKK